MVRNGGGNIVTIASISGKEGDVQNAHYSASKAAAINFTQTLAKELAGANVRVNAICPGTVATPMSELFATSWGTTVEDVAAEYQLIKRPQHPREIAAAVLFVATMPSITGQAINVDGGAVFH
jgi:3-oxoacyl-[acyl-carrier protein] reductase